MVWFNEQYQNSYCSIIKFHKCDGFIIIQSPNWRVQWTHWTRSNEVPDRYLWCFFLLPLFLGFHIFSSFLDLSMVYYGKFRKLWYWMGDQSCLILNELSWTVLRRAPLVPLNACIYRASASEPTDARNFCSRTFLRSRVAKPPYKPF